MNVKVNFMATPSSQAAGFLDVKEAKQASSGFQEGSGLPSSTGDISRISIADPFHVDADLNLAFDFDADADPEPTIHSDSDPDPITNLFPDLALQWSTMDQGFHFLL